MGGARRTEEGITALLDAARIFGELGERSREAMAQLDLGSVLLIEGRAEEAIPNCREAARKFRELGEQHDESQALTNLAGAWSWGRTTRPARR